MVSWTSVSCATHAHLAGALMVLKHSSACMTMVGEGGTTRVSPIDPEKIGQSIMV